MNESNNHRNPNSAKDMRRDFLNSFNERTSKWVCLHKHERILGQCALGSMIVFRGMDGKETRWPGQYQPPLHGLWDRLRLRYPGFQYLTAPLGREVGLAFRTF
jgi:hypothetical protein